MTRGERIRHLRENINAVYFVCDKKEYLVLNSSDFIKKW